MSGAAPRPTPAPTERLRLVGVDWLLPCTGAARGAVRSWAELGLRGATVVRLKRAAGDGEPGPWIVSGLENPGDSRPAPDERVLDLGGVGLTPGWVDAHTHAVFAGDRAAEFNQRLAGRSYAEIAAEGGGILRTMAATRAASVADLVAAATPRLEEMIAWGTRVVEIKTGYGLDLASEVRLLRAIGALATRFAGRLQVVATAMPGHAIPPEWRHDPNGYVAVVCDEILPALAALRGDGAQDGASGGAPRAVIPCSFMDVFIERGYFTAAHAERMAQVASNLGIALKAHVDEFADIGGLDWAVARGAVSVEHLLVTDAPAIARLAASETVAVCLPLTSVFLREGYAPMRALVDAGCQVAVATDCNPGSAMSANLHLALQMAVLGGRLTPQEAMRAVTVGGAAALGGPAGPLGWDGRLRVGGRFVATALAVDGPDRLFYELGGLPRGVEVALQPPAVIR